MRLILKVYNSLFLGILISALLFSCKKQSTLSLADQDRIFNLIPAEQSGIHFKNTVTDDEKNNALVYETFYNGGGVGLGDFDNDGLIDVYLGGNQVGDRLYRNKGNLQFEDITESAGILNKGGWSTGISVVDINNDGWQDIYVCKSLYDENPELRINELYLNQGNGKFIEVAQDFGLADAWRSQQAYFFDADLDGDLDLFLVNQPPNPGMLSPLKTSDWRDPALGCRFFQNQNNRFVDKTEGSGLYHAGYPLSAAIGDFNNDGWPDIYVAHDYNSPDGLFMNQKNGNFKNTIHESFEHISFFAMGTDFGDINNDGWQDLLVLDMVADDHFRNKANMGGMDPNSFWELVEQKGHYQYMFNTLQLNQGPGPDGNLKFGDIAQLANLSNTDWSWSPLIADFDNDGNVDIFISNGIKRDLRYTDGSSAIKAQLKQTMEGSNGAITQENILQNVDALSLLEKLPSTKLRNYFYKNEGNLSFVNKSEKAGLEAKTFSSGAAYADLDNDGDLDLVINNIDDFSFLYKNTSEVNNNNFISLELTPNKGKSILGTQVDLFGKDFQLTQQVTNAKGFYSTSQSRVHFGLGKKSNIEKIIISWPGGEKQIVKAVKLNQLNKIKYAPSGNDSPSIVSPGISNEAANFGLSVRHVENEFDDFEKQILLPHKLSVFGPALAKADVNGDGLEDVFVGGSAGLAAQLFFQNSTGQFEEQQKNLWNKEKKYEQVDAHFFDYDQDGDQDLYVVSGGNEYDNNSPDYQDRLYQNNGKGVFSITIGVLPNVAAPGARIAISDYDGDGDQDIFVGIRHISGAYPFPPSSYLLVNSKASNGTTIFENKTAELAPSLDKIGMVTDATWADLDGDQDEDLAIVGEWMSVKIFTNEKGVLKEDTEKYGLEETVGWWFSVAANDVDGDGDQDLLLGNLGANYKYKKSEEEAFEIYFGDFDENGDSDIVLSEEENGVAYPIRGRSCSSDQIPEIKNKFVNYKSFASASVQDIYGEKLKEDQHYEIDIFKSGWLLNDQGKQLNFQPFSNLAQMSTINDFVVHENKGQELIIAANNFFGAEIETPRADAGAGLVLSKGNVPEVFAPLKTGLYLKGQINNLEIINIKGKDYLLYVPNNDVLHLLDLSKLKT